MRTAALGRTGIEISRVVFGGIIVSGEEQREADRFVAFAVENGVNYFDVAPSYGNAEELLGPALEPYREEVYLSCKTVERSAAGARNELERSLKNLHTDHLDVYQMHAITTREDIDAIFAEDGALRAFIKAKEEGLIRNIGFSAHDEEAALAALSRFDFDTVMFPLNWALALGKNFGPRIAGMCREKGTGLLGMKNISYRKLRAGEETAHPKSWYKIVYDDREFAKRATKFTLSLGAAAVVPPGNFDPFRLCVDTIGECEDVPLTDEDIRYLRSMLPDESEQIF